MSDRLFLDTNVLFDFVFEREPFINEAEILFKLREKNSVEFYLSALSLANIAYFAKKLNKNPQHIISIILEWFNVVPLDSDSFIQTLSADFKDFEDGLQYFSASRINGLHGIITRNKKDFESSTLPVMTPSEYIKSQNISF
jgi:predicted nucleic acid-binding protein